MFFMQTCSRYADIDFLFCCFVVVAVRKNYLISREFIYWMPPVRKKFWSIGYLLRVGYREQSLSYDIRSGKDLTVQLIFSHPLFFLSIFRELGSSLSNPCKRKVGLWWLLPMLLLEAWISPMSLLLFIMTLPGKWMVLSIAPGEQL